jgi:hypothetical protein
MMAVSSTLLTLAACHPRAGAAVDPGVRCQGLELKATGKRARSILGCHARAILRQRVLDPACVGDAESAFARAFAAAEALGGCPAGASAAAIATTTDAFVARALAAASAGEASAHCIGARLSAMSSYAGRLLAAHKRYKTKPDDAQPLAVARSAAARAFADALARAACDTAADVDALALAVEEFVVDAAGGLLCGDGVRDPAEVCDGGDDDACPGACQADCRCALSPSPFACLSRQGPVFDLSGTHTSRYDDPALPPAAELDARGATFLASPSNLYPLDLGGGSGACFAGGTVQGQYDRTLSWDAMHTMNNAGIRFENARFTVAGLRIDDVTDGIRPVGGPFTVTQAWLSYVRDDCVENDHVQGGLIADSLLDGCYVAVSERPSPAIIDERFDGRRKVLALHGSLIRLQPMPGPRGGSATDLGNGQFFKWHELATKLALHDNVFMAERVGQSGADSMGIPDVLVSCAHNVMVWLGAGAYPAPLPRCFTITTDRAVWDDAVAAWKQRHPGVGD